MSLAKEFKEFAMKGNVIDMAVGVVVGAAFGKIIASIVDDIIMPPLGLLIGGVHFSDLAVSLGMSSIQFALLGHTGFAIGVGRRLLDELLKLVQSGKGRPGQIAGDGAFLE